MKKSVLCKSLALLLALLMILPCMSAVAFAAELKGSGTEADPYIIENADQLVELSKLSGVGYVSLADDIDMSGIEPQTSFIKKLTGAFMGYGHKIKNLSLKGGGNGNFVNPYYIGFIGNISGNVTVRDVIFENVSVTDDIGNYNYAGIVAGLVSEGSNAAIDNCIINGTITSSSAVTAYLGGAVASADGNINNPTTLSVKNTVSNVAITAASSNYAGALLAVSQYYITLNVENCAILGNVSGSARYAGGIASYASSAGTTSFNIENTYLGAKIDGSKKLGICYNSGKFNSIKTNAFYYDTKKNPSPSSWSSFDMLYSGNSADLATGKTTDEIKALKLDGFEVREGEFDNYPVPVWKPMEPPKTTEPTVIPSDFTAVKKGDFTYIPEGSETSVTVKDTTTIVAYATIDAGSSVISKCGYYLTKLYDDAAAATIKLPAIGVPAGLKYGIRAFGDALTAGKYSVQPYIIKEDGTEIKGEAKTLTIE